ncbi:MAG: UDP-3-O-acyl-N-acetylglucosamine deacetylase [Pseudomonadota bacterium]|nr:UDP-3-O-acyl-N-acetylglucosamine deacetylase [Pseudomonadota bacterium]
MIYRQTLAAPAVCAGIGLHTGERVRMVLQPASAGSGIRFVRSDIADRDNSIAARADAVSEVRLGTTLQNAAGVSIATVEHLMAALAGLGVDDAVIEVDGSEIPVMDGSSAPFVELIEQVGLKSQSVPRRAIQVLRPVSIEDDERRARFLPALKPMIEIEIAFEHQAVGRQACVFDITPEIFSSDIARARTFGFKKDYDALLAAGLARGGSMDNAVVLDETGIANPEGLRFKDEFVRHKALDAVGDLYLAGAPIIGCYSAERPGHAVNNAALRALLDDTSAWKWVNMRDEAAADVALAHS